MSYAGPMNPRSAITARGSLCLLTSVSVVVKGVIIAAPLQ